jgi:hypothetical protein
MENCGGNGWSPTDYVGPFDISSENLTVKVPKSKLSKYKKFLVSNLLIIIDANLSAADAEVTYKTF